MTPKQKAAKRAFRAFKDDDQDAFTAAFEDMVALCTDEIEDDEDEEDDESDASSSAAFGMAAVN